MNTIELLAISPIDGRYNRQTELLGSYFSEYALMKFRTHVEIEYFISLCEIPIPQLKDFPKDKIETLRKITTDFDIKDGKEIKEIIDEYQKLVDEEKSVEKLNEFIKENLPKVSQLEGNTMLDGLESAMKRELEDLRAELEDLDTDFELVNIIDVDGYLKEDKIDEIKNEDLKEKVEKAYENYYRILSREGSIEPVIDYTKLMDFENKVTSEWKEYLELQSEELENPAYADGALLITFDELGERILKIEIGRASCRERV